MHPQNPHANAQPHASANSYTETSNSQYQASTRQLQFQDRVEWSTDGLCDVNNCRITWWCPCVTFGRIAEMLDNGSPSCGGSGAVYVPVAFVAGCACLYSCIYRDKTMRQLFLLKDKPCCDCSVHYFCEPCALCQEYRELQHRGFDMLIGWHAN